MLFKDDLAEANTTLRQVRSQRRRLPMAERKNLDPEVAEAELAVAVAQAQLDKAKAALAKEKAEQQMIERKAAIKEAEMVLAGATEASRHGQIVSARAPYDVGSLSCAEAEQSVLKAQAEHRVAQAEFNLMSADFEVEVARLDRAEARVAYHLAEQAQKAVSHQARDDVAHASKLNDAASRFATAERKVENAIANRNAPFQEFQVASLERDLMSAQAARDSLQRRVLFNDHLANKKAAQIQLEQAEIHVANVENKLRRHVPFLGDAMTPMGKADAAIQANFAAFLEAHASMKWDEVKSDFFHTLAAPMLLDKPNTKASFPFGGKGHPTTQSLSLLMLRKSHTNLYNLLLSQLCARKAK